MYNGGIILNITKRYREIAEKLEISETNLRSKIKELIKLKLIEKKDNNLIFINLNKIKIILKLKTNRNFKIKYYNPKELEIIIKSLAIEENLSYQKYKIQQKIITKELRKFGKIETYSTKKKIRKQITKNVSNLTENYLKRELFYSTNNNHTKKEINGDITISRRGIAYLFNKKSKSTGTRFIDKMKILNLVLIDQSRIKLIHKNININIYKSLELGSSYYRHNNNLFQRKSNKLTLSKFYV